MGFVRKLLQNFLCYFLENRNSFTLKNRKELNPNSQNNRDCHKYPKFPRNSYRNLSKSSKDLFGLSQFDVKTIQTYHLLIIVSLQRMSCVSST